jgi:bacillithiol system protein YtxJ
MVHWIDLANLAQLETIAEQSKTKPVVVFKHSTRCSISRMALKQFEHGYPDKNQQPHFYLLDLLNHRDISAAIAQRWQIVHESPQLLLIQNDKAVYHRTHDNIDAEETQHQFESSL